MIYSMTGFGKATFDLNNTQYTVEIKSLNSKQADVFTRIPNLMKELEISMRKELISLLQRGKIELNINSTKSEEGTEFTINTELLKKYQEQVANLDLPSNDLLGALLRLPNVVVPAENLLDENASNIILAGIREATNDLISFRKNEGESLFEDLKLRINNIMKHKAAIQELAPMRIDRLRTKMIENIKALSGDLEINEERVEQELIFYIEKLDVTEEFVRLKAHGEYFMEIMNDEEAVVGKKLNFISQELGREINTLGSKANDADIQKHVVQMKDELEKIKEQVNNVL